MASSPIAIVGGGIGGLTLSRCLKQLGIPSVIYERSPSFTRHNYGITLLPEAAGALAQCLQWGLDQFLNEISIGTSPRNRGHVDRETVVSLQWQEIWRRVNRCSLEQRLYEGLNIKHGRELRELSRCFDSNGVRAGWTLHFMVGDPVHHDVLVAADGIHSVARGVLPSKCVPRVLPYVVFNGKRRLPRRKFDELYAPSMGSSNIIETRHGDVFLQISINSHDIDSGYGAAPVVDISWVYSRRAATSDGRHTDPVFRPDRSNADARKIPDLFWVEVNSLTHLGQPFKDLFVAGKMKDDRPVNWLMRDIAIPSLPELQALAGDGVVFLGDSIHAEPILGGEGANAAIMDGVTLAKHIANHGIATVADWYDGRYQCWKDSLKRSRSRIRKMYVTVGDVDNAGKPEFSKSELRKA